MSRILRRPMFRGGPVSSYGTGIASGLANGGRVGFDNGGFLPNPGPYPDLRLGSQIMADQKYKSLFNQYGSQDPTKVEDITIEDKIEETPEKVSFNNIVDYNDEIEGNEWMDQYENWDDVPIWKKNVPFTKDIWENKQEIKKAIENTERTDGFLPTPGPQKGVTTVDNTPQVVDPKTAKVIEPAESYEINADDVRAQAALFDELLNEGYEKDKKSAQISDASDYALQFFKSTVGEGKGMKEAAGDVAGRALATPSRTEKVQEGKKKTKQTATVMAINEALASNKSDRELDKMFAKMGLDEQMRKRLLVERINLETAVARGMSIRKRVNADKSSGTSDMNKLRNHTKGFAEDFEKTNELPTGSVEVTSFLTEKKEGSKLPLYTDKKVLLVEENKNQIFIDEATKRVYQVVEDTNGNLTFKTLAQ